MVRIIPLKDGEYNLVYGRKADKISNPHR